jgi:hypothetical protein
VVGVLVGFSRPVAVRYGSSSLVRHSGRSRGYSFGHVRGGAVVAADTGWQLQSSCCVRSQGQRR